MRISESESVGMVVRPAEQHQCPAKRAMSTGGKFQALPRLSRVTGKVVHLETCGYRDAEQNLPMQTDTIFRIYSMTKPITSVALMMLYEQGKFQL